MRKRDELSKWLHEICDNVYFQPGSNMTLKYPCIVYEFEKPLDKLADNDYYGTYGKYQLTHIYKAPSNRKFDEFRKLPYCNWNQSFITEGFYHDIYVIYF